MRKFVCFLITIIIVVAGATFTFGETDKENEKVYYEQVEIKSGDTLWSISQKYKNRIKILFYNDRFYPKKITVIKSV